MANEFDPLQGTHNISEYPALYNADLIKVRGYRTDDYGLGSAGLPTDAIPGEIVINTHVNPNFNNLRSIWRFNSAGNAWNLIGVMNDAFDGCLPRYANPSDGSLYPMQANINMGLNKIVALANGVDPSDAVNLSQVSGLGLKYVTDLVIWEGENFNNDLPADINRISPNTLSFLNLGTPIMWWALYQTTSTGGSAQVDWGWWLEHQWYYPDGIGVFGGVAAGAQEAFNQLVPYRAIDGSKSAPSVGVKFEVEADPGDPGGDSPAINGNITMEVFVKHTDAAFEKRSRLLMGFCVGVTELIQGADLGYGRT